MSIIRRYKWIIGGGTTVLFAVFLFRVFLTHDTPIVIAGGSIRAHCYTDRNCLDGGWTEVGNDHNSYIVKVFARIIKIEVTEKKSKDDDDDKGPHETAPDGLADKIIQPIDIPFDAYNNWSIEIDTLDSGGQADGKAITIKPDVNNDPKGTTLKITISDEAAQTAKWEKKPGLASQIRYRGNHKTCVADQSSPDPLGLCDKLLSVHVTVGGKAQPPVTCKTSEVIGKCKIKFWT